jgi:recombination protein RecA
LCCVPAACLPAESSGKTTLALHAMAEVQKQGGTVALIDAEHAFDALFAKVSEGAMEVCEGALRPELCCSMHAIAILPAALLAYSLARSLALCRPTACLPVQRLGLNVDDMVLCQPDCGEMALETVDSLIR